MAVCTYDNPHTMRRECWQDGKLLCFYTFSLLSQHGEIPAKYLFFGANIGKIIGGQIVGDVKAIDEEKRKLWELE